MKLLILIALFLKASAVLCAVGTDKFGPLERLGTLSEALYSISTTSARVLFNTARHIEMLEKHRCTSSFYSLKLQCLMNASQSLCNEIPSANSKKNCLSYIDVILVNQLNVEAFLKPEERLEIFKKFRQPQVEIRLELNRRYGALCTQFLFSPHFPGPASDFKTLAQSIDLFCLDRTQDGTDGKQSWQVCVSAMIWFIGTRSS